MTLQVTLDEKKISPMQLQELLTLIDSLGGTTFDKEDNQILTFAFFQKINAIRSQEAFTHCSDWGIQDWALCVAGEAGELANKVKKVRRGDSTLEESRYSILAEAADVLTYGFSLVDFLGADAADVITRKFNEVSTRVGWRGIRL